MLTISGLTYRIGGRTLIDQASAQIAEGSKVGLVGRNGAGKSTLLDLIRGALQPDGGSIELPRGYRIGFLAQEAPGGEASALETVARRRQRARRPARRAGGRGGAAARRRDRGPARRDRRPFGAEPGRAHPGRARPRRGDAAPADRRSVGRLADAGRARGDPLRRARPAAARRADQPSRPRSRAVARAVSAQLSPHPDPGQPRPPLPQRGDDANPASPTRQTDRLFRRLRRLSARPYRGGAAARILGAPAEFRTAADAGFCRPLSLQGVKGAPGAEPAQGAGPAGADRSAGRRGAGAHRLPGSSRS